MSNFWGSPAVHTETVYGQALCVARWRNGGSAPPLLFLNGVGADARSAKPLLGRITDREVWTLDMPGTGGSPDALLPYTAPAIAAAVMEIANRLGHRRFDLAGFSWGGALAQQIVVQFPHRVRRLVLMATTPSLGLPGIGWGITFDGDMITHGLRAPRATPLGLVYQGMALAGWSSAAMLPLLRDIPALILMARDDGVVPTSHGQLLAGLIDGAQLEIVSGSHLFPFTQAARTAARITAFLDAAPATSVAA